MTNEITIKTLRLKTEVVNKVSDLAKENNRTFNNMVETILLKFDPKDYPRLM